MAESLYTTGGTVQAQEGGLYLVRPADQQLLELCRQSRFAYVLTPRQLGKSSLMIRTAEELLAEGFRAVTVDLTRMTDASGRALAPFPVPGTSPAPRDVVRRALDYRVPNPLR
jgi:hypothetical protein